MKAYRSHSLELRLSALRDRLLLKQSGLKKVGGSYLFYHRMLMEHLARSEE